MSEQKTYTSKEAYTLLGLNPNTFFSRVAVMGLKPINYNPNLIRQRAGIWTQEQVDQIAGYADAYRAARREQSSFRAAS